jgi:SAM-dependent methyltransferase
MQQKQDAWKWQWEHIQDHEQWLFQDWIAPTTLEDFRGKTVLDCGCGGGQHTSFVAPLASKVVGVDLNAVSAARERTAPFANVQLIDADLATMSLPEQFDIVYCIGVIHHTDSPDKTFTNLLKHCKPGGKLIVWCYSYEGNFLNRTLVEGAKSILVHALPRRAVWWLGKVLTALVYLPVYSIYLLPLTFLPYYEYFQNWRKMSFERNFLNVFDKLNAPQTEFITKARIQSWFSSDHFTNVHISAYKGVSWRGSGTVL